MKLRWYRLLLFALPPDFRREFGDAMTDATRTALWQAASPASRLHLTARALHDLARTVGREWTDRLLPRTPAEHLRDATRLPGSRPHMENTMFDRSTTLLRQTTRRLARQPGSALLVIATLAIGLGSTVAIYSHVHAALLKPLPFAEADRLVSIWPAKTFSKKMLDRFRDETESFGAVAGYSGWILTLTGEERSDEIHAVAVTPGFFDVLDIAPSLGRVLDAADSNAGAEKVVLLGHGLWRTRFGGDPEVVDRVIDFGALDGNQETQDRRRVVGVLPDRYESIVPKAQIYFPLTVDPADTRDYGGSWYLKVVGRLAAGHSIESSSAEVASVATTLKTEFRGISDEELAQAQAVPLHRWIVGDVQQPLLILLGAVVMVLLVACTNVASLLIGRTAARRQELSLRAALGANRRRLITELLAESAVLAAAGGAFGLLLALGLARFSSAVIPDAAPRLHQAGLNLPVLLFALAATCGVALAAGLPAAWRVAGRSAKGDWQTRGGTSNLGERAQLGLIVVEVALSVILLVGAGLVLKSFSRLLDTELGFSPNAVTALRVSPPATKYQQDPAWHQVNRALQQELQSIPGVETVGGIHLLPMTLNNWSFPYTTSSLSIADDAAPPTANYRVIVGDYFESLEIPLLSGRRFQPQDGSSGEPVVIINQALAEELWGLEESLDRELLLFMSQPHRIVGIVGNVRQHKLDLEPQPEMYYPLEQRGATGGMAFMIRSDLPPEDLYPVLRESVRAVDPAIAIGELLSMDAAIGRSATEQRSIALLLSGFSVIAIVLSLVGVYGVMAFLVGRRLRDIGVRLALGARRERVTREAVARVGRWILCGLALGALGALALGRLIGSQLYQVQATDALVLWPVLIGVGFSALIASWAPIRRASRLDPVRVLRAD